jgi:hypothetical protein
MPDPIRPLALLAGEQESHAEGHVPDETSGDAKVTDICIAGTREEEVSYEARTTGDGSPIVDVLTSTTEANEEDSPRICATPQAIGVSLAAPIGVSLAASDAQLGMTFKLDPLGRDAPRGGDASKSKNAWSVEPLAKYLKNVTQIVESNINKKRLPTEEKLDAFVAKLVREVHRQVRHAPKKVRPNLTRLCACRFDRFHDFTRNQRVVTPSPEELKIALTTLVEALLAEFVTRPLRVNPIKQGSRQWAAPWLHTSLVDVCVA